jgi:hydrogenase 3 maturation protease
VEKILKILKGRVVVAGVGAVERGDDGFGPRLVQRLSALPNLYTIDCGDRPENYIGDIAQACPDTVLIADAVDMGAEPGQMAVLEAKTLKSFVGGSHCASLETTMSYLQQRTGASVFLLGMQPAVINEQLCLSPMVAAGVEALENFFRSWPGSRAKTSSSQPKQRDP